MKDDASTDANIKNGTWVKPEYSRVSDWANYITNNTDVESVISTWKTRAANAGREATPYRVTVSGSNVTCNMTIDNLWSSYQVKGQGRTTGGISFNLQGGSNAHLTITLVGDNRFGNIFYSSGSNTSITIGGGSDDTLTLANIANGADTNWWCAALGSNDNYGTAKGINMTGGTIYAGTTAADDCTAIGGGGNGVWGSCGKLYQA